MSTSYIRLGTSSWAYEGWRDIVYFKKYTRENFKRTCLAEYAADSRFSTVGMDLFFYQPPTVSLLEHYASQLPPGFMTCSKVWEDITIFRFPKTHHHTELKEKVNPNYLNATIFLNTVLKPYATAFKDHTGPFIFEFQYMKKNDKSLGAFVYDLDKFFAQLPHDFMYSVEIRNANFLHPDYFDVLRKHRVAHVFNQWSYMPSISQQLAYDSLTADFLIARALTPPGIAYEATVKKFSPYNKIISPLPAVRLDLLQLMDIAIKNRKYAYLLINNRLEGCAPLTVQELKTMAEEKLSDSGDKILTD